MRHRNYTWAELMKRVYLVDVLECERCGGTMKILAAIYPPETTEKNSGVSRADLPGPAPGVCRLRLQPDGLLLNSA